MDDADRIVPDFVVIGAAKSGTTSVWRWLRTLPDCFVASPKEIDFFCSDEQWRRGVAWYRAQFAEARPDQPTGEVSPNCTMPDRAASAAERLARTAPGARLVFLARDPLERLRSQYRHEVQRGRERRSLAEAVAATDSPYVLRSLYSACLDPYFAAFPPDRIAVIRFEDLVDDEASGWTSLLRFLGLEVRPRPEAPVNTTAEKRQFRRVTLKLYETNLLRFASRLPGPVRRAGRSILTRGGDPYRRLMDRSRAELPPEVERRIREDADRLAARIGADAPLWPRDQASPTRSRPPG